VNEAHGSLLDALALEVKNGTLPFLQIAVLKSAAQFWPKRFK